MSPAVTAPTLWNYTVCVQFPGVVGEGATVFAVCAPDVPPLRYLIVQVEVASGYLNFCEIEVLPRSKLLFASSYVQSRPEKK